MISGSPRVGPFLQAFFADHLIEHKRVSRQTVASYRDTFRLLLQFIREQARREPSALRIADLDAPVILAFLDALERGRGNCVGTRNVRLAAIRTFFRLVALRDPGSAGIATRVLAIPRKRTDYKLVGYLSRPEIDSIVGAPDPSSRSGRRDRALLLTLYNTGARVSEITALVRQDVLFDNKSFIQLKGKGRKERTVPIWTKTARVLKAWVAEIEARPDAVLFPNARGKALSRDGVDYILRHAVAAASIACPGLLGKRVSPHVVRHTTAMHLLQAGVDITVIALWMGHESIETTHKYVEADLATKEHAIGKIAPSDGKPTRFAPGDALLNFLASL